MAPRKNPDLQAILARGTNWSQNRMLSNCCRKFDLQDTEFMSCASKRTIRFSDRQQAADQRIGNLSKHNHAARGGASAERITPGSNVMERPKNRPMAIRETAQSSPKQLRLAVLSDVSTEAVVRNPRNALWRPHRKQLA